MADISTIRNLGPKTEAALKKVGVATAEDLQKIGADAAYLRLLRSGVRPHFIGYYVMVMGLRGRPWNDARGAEKKALRARFDALKAEAAATPSADADRARIEAALDALGVVASRKTD